MGSRNKRQDYIPWLRDQLLGTPITDFHRLVLAEAEQYMTTQNSGVTMDAFTSFRESAKDTNLVGDDTSYFGIVKNILELDYEEFTEVVFLCDWVLVEDKTTGSYVDAETNTRFVNFEKFKRSSKEVDEPFIHALKLPKSFILTTSTGWRLGAGGVIRHSSGSYVAAFAHDLFLNSYAVAELWSISDGLVLALKHHISHLIVDSNSSSSERSSFRLSRRSALCNFLASISPGWV
ncbi:hypothetical protein C5167_042647 [Papaver somniferum]|uniref:RNase H type-1 domain-containing protein n=1 Tax=Papaver somniferum TaxID=3469 RepID=A0A4Y7L6R5_PAPSO|nr:hypothetical protein C5167_042647 [Papaver somniferum]